MDAYDFVHLALLAIGGEIKGNTKLQKTVYFLGVLTGQVDELGYRPHFYGPYSEEVADAINCLKSIGFVDQNVVGYSTADQFGSEMLRYDYLLNSDGKEIAEKKKKKHPTLWRKITEAAKALDKAGEIDYMELSIAAKTYFMLGEKKGKATDEELAKLARRFGWKVSGDEVRSAAQYLGKIGLVELVN